MIAVELDCDEETEAYLANLLEHLFDAMPYQYSVSIQGTS